MTALKLKILANDLDQLVKFLGKEFKFDYKNHSDDMSVLMVEDFYLLNMSVQLNMIIVKRKESFILVDVIGAAGDFSLFDIFSNPERSFTKKVDKVLQVYGAKFSFTVEYLR